MANIPNVILVQAKFGKIDEDIHGKRLQIQEREAQKQDLLCVVRLRKRICNRVLQQQELEAELQKDRSALEILLEIFNNLSQESSETRVGTYIGPRIASAPRY
jgi:hypothetical protein